jgi:hypothetical protein
MNILSYIYIAKNSALPICPLRNIQDGRSAQCPLFQLSSIYTSIHPNIANNSANGFPGEEDLNESILYTGQVRSTDQTS